MKSVFAICTFITLSFAFNAKAADSRIKDCDKPDCSDETWMMRAEKRSHYCEEVTESYVICNGERYEKATSTNDNLKRDMKRVEPYVNPARRKILESSPR